MASATIVTHNNNDASYVAKERAARNALQQSKDQYEREIKVIISTVNLDIHASDFISIVG